MIDFTKRAKVRDLGWKRSKTYDSVCKEYRVIFSEILYGGRDRYAPRWLAVEVLPTGERIISRHRKREAAVRAVQKYARGSR